MNKFNLIIGIIASIALILGILGNLPKSIQLGGTTADDWNVGGNLSVTGTGTITGAGTITGVATLSSTLAVAATSTLSDSLIVNKSGGLVAIGTTTPATTFDLYNSNTTSSMYIYSGGSNSGGSIIMEASGTGGGTCIELRFDTNGSFATSTINCGSRQR